MLETLPEDELKKMQIKFDIAYVVSTQHMAFAKYPEICSLEARHGVNVGSTYRNVNSCKDFIHFWSMSKKEKLASLLSRAKFFSLLMDGSTDAANVDNEVFLVV